MWFSNSETEWKDIETLAELRFYPYVRGVLLMSNTDNQIESLQHENIFHYSAIFSLRRIPK